MSSKQFIIDQNGQAIYHRNFLSGDHFSELQDSLPWQQNEIRVYGKTYPEPRLTCWFGPPYQYSNIKWPAREIPEILKIYLQEINVVCDFEFNSVLANFYRHGQDSNGWHADNEPEMDTSMIASLSFGATRKFKLRHNSSKQTIDLQLENNSLLVMRDLQEQWQHTIPKTKKVDTGRINLTFRKILR